LRCLSTVVCGMTQSQYAVFKQRFAFEFYSDFRIVTHLLHVHIMCPYNMAARNKRRCTAFVASSVSALQYFCCISATGRSFSISGFRVGVQDSAIGGGGVAGCRCSPEITGVGISTGNDVSTATASQAKPAKLARPIALLRSESDDR